MAILRYTASIDNTITNAFEANLTQRGTGSNMGYADSVEIFSIAGQLSSSTAGASQELSRAIIQFPITQINAARTAGTLPASGSVSFFLRMYNAETPWTLPQGYTLEVVPISTEWVEGTGLDMESYQDLGKSNWMSASTTTAWTSMGGDYDTTAAGNMYKVAFPLGWEDIELDISGLVEQWIAGPGGGGIDNYGVGIYLTSSEEAYASASSVGGVISNVGGSTESYYTKKFFARSTEFFFKRPVIEARWDSTIQDQRGQFYYSSSLAPAPDNLNTLYIYNYVRGRLVDIPAVGVGNISVSFYSGSTVPTGSRLRLSDTNYTVTGSRVSTGIYKVDVAITGGATPLETIFDVWRSGSVEYFTSSFNPVLPPQYNNAPTFNYATTIRNLKSTYTPGESARFRTFVRDKNWSPTIYVKAVANNPTQIITSASYSIYRVVDNLEVISFGTGSNDYNCTYLSYDVSGNYFDLDMGLLDAGYMYGIKLAYYNDSIGSWIEQPETFKFRVEE